MYWRNELRNFLLHQLHHLLSHFLAYIVCVGGMARVWHKLSDIGVFVWIYIFRCLAEYIRRCNITDYFKRTRLSLDLQKPRWWNVLVVEVQLVVTFILLVVHRWLLSLLGTLWRITHILFSNNVFIHLSVATSLTTALQSSIPTSAPLFSAYLSCLIYSFNLKSDISNIAYSNWYSN